MNLLVIGSGGREHALVWKLAQSPGARIFAAPGNPGIERHAQLVAMKDTSPAAYLAAAESIDADLTVVGPEAPLVAGIVDAFRAAGRRIAGPTAEAAQLEGSKIHAKQFFHEHGIPTARFINAGSPAAAIEALRQFSYPVVIKADGLAAGKGVIIAADRAEAEAAITTLGGRLVIEEFLTGEEVSFIALCDGRDAVALEPTQDHKAVFDNDTGPNTGGMGAYSDSRILSSSRSAQILDTVIRPTVAATRFTGFLYAGLMMTAGGPKVLEFNVRLGDPETQPLMHRLESDLASTLLAAAEGRLAHVRLNWRLTPSICVVLASEGYPGSYPTGLPICGIDAAEATGAVVFHAGTRIDSGRIVTGGGRVLGVTASGSDLEDAISRAYSAAAQIKFDGMHYRKDIGAKGLKRYSKRVGAQPRP